MRKQSKGNEILGIAGAVAVLGFVVYSATYIAKLASYHMFYKGMVKDTIKEENESNRG